MKDFYAIKGSIYRVSAEWNCLREASKILNVARALLFQANLPLCFGEMLSTLLLIQSLDFAAKFYPTNL